MALGVIIGLLVRFVRNRSLGGLTYLRICGVWLIFVAAAIKLVLAAVSRLPLSPPNEFLTRLHISLYVVLIGLVWANRHLRGMWLVLFGVVANALVIVANSGRMPVTREAIIVSGQPRLIEWLSAGHDPVHALADPATRLVVLGDWIPFHVSLIHIALSPGDIFLAVGAMLVLNLNPAVDPI